MIKQILLRGLRDERGVAAVEFAIITPVIALLAATSFMVWEFADRHQDMRSALKVGAEYYQNGGTDDAVAASLVQNGWRNRPATSAMTVSRACRCGTTAIACTDLCPASRPPAVYVTLTASAPGLDVNSADVMLDTTTVRVR
ncbi:TadE/TadG family type IV pilus assembly protein [Phenylobacterium sp.]|uniref:TadE/TadG family type IV pilus assembly protein n=1 Tax=Phenylobacterium sp. TaxID=1871053 RepID=UPI002FCB08A3